MKDTARGLIYFAVAVGVHGLFLFGVGLGGPAFISDAESGPDATEVALVENAEEAAEEPSAPEPEPPQPQQPPQPPLPVEPPQPEPPPDPVPPEPAKPEMTQPEPQPVEPKPEPPKSKPAAPKPAPRPAAKPAAPRPQVKPGPPAAGLGSPNGTPGAPAGRPGAGDNGHASWRNKVRPTYPEAARSARISGSVQIQVNVNALGQATGVRVVRSSGSPMLDEAALRAVRASSFNPKRLAGIPMPDTIIVPITFRLDS